MGKIDVFTVVEANRDFPRHGSPTIVELQDGRLLLAWMESVGGPLLGNDHAPCNIAAMVSCDGGYTWADRRILVENHPGDTNIHFPCFMRLPDGKILFYYLIRHSLEPGVPAESSGLVCFSDDEGQTFSEPIRHEALSEKGGNGNVMVKLSSGRLLLPAQQYQHGIWGGPLDHQISGCYYSDDQGLSWSISDTWFDLPLRGTMEPHIVELKDGRLLSYMRTQLGALFQTESLDGGVTWSKPQTTGIRAPESKPCLVKIAQRDDLLLIWNHSLFDPQFDHSGLRTPLTVAISRDEGHAWENIKNIETDPRFEFTNPACHFTSQGKAIIMYEASKMDDPNPPGRLGRSQMHMKAAVMDIGWFYE